MIGCAPHLQRDTEGGEQDMVVLWQEESVFNFSFAPHVELGYTAFSQSVCERIASSFGKITRGGEHVSVRSFCRP